MVTISYFMIYFMHLLAGALLITGFFAITRGTELMKPNGSVKRVGKIFKGWYFFWMKEREMEYRSYYFDNELIKIISQIRALRPAADIKVLFEDSKTAKNLGRGIMTGVFDQYFWAEVEVRFGIKVEVEKDFVAPAGGADYSWVVFRLYKKEPNYVFPWYLRDMMACCITCHSSWLGSICFWIPVILGIYGFDYCPFLFFVMWPLYCISQAFVVTALWKKFM